MQDIQPKSTVDRMEAIGRLGFTISICCGPAGKVPFRWSVQVLSPSGDEFTQPFAAYSFGHAVLIAEQEIQRRGWTTIVNAFL